MAAVVSALGLIAAHIRTLACEQFAVLEVQMEDIDKKLSAECQKQMVKDEVMAKKAMAKPIKIMIAKMQEVKKKYPLCSMTREPKEDLSLFWKQCKYQSSLAGRIRMMSRASSPKDWTEGHNGRSIEETRYYTDSKNQVIKALGIRALDIYQKAERVFIIKHIKNDQILSCLGSRAELEDVAHCVQLVLKRYAPWLSTLPTEPHDNPYWKGPRSRNDSNPAQSSKLRKPRRRVR